MNPLQDAVRRIDRYAAGLLSATGAPGLALALTDRHGLVWQAAYGLADLAAQTPLTTSHLFEIGSIGKSFTSLALLQAAEAGLLNLHAPISQVMPWVAFDSAFDPITPHHLLCHTAGLSAGADFAPCSRYEIWALRLRPLPVPPGGAFHYSNVGYKLLGFLLEDILQQPYGDILQARILDPLGMADSDALTTHATRQRMPIGYDRACDDRPWQASQPLAPATWVEYGSGDGSPACTPADLAAYLRMLLNRGAGPNGRVLSEAAFALLTHKAAQRGEGWYYGYGLDVREVKGHTYVGHGGGTLGYRSSMVGDLDSGVGVVAFTNGPVGVMAPAAGYALAALRAAVDGQPLPEPPPLPEPGQVTQAGDYAGTYTNGRRSLRLEAASSRLWLVEGKARLALEARGPDCFYVNHPDFALDVLRFERAGEQVIAASHGPDYFAREGAAMRPAAVPPAPEMPAEWAAYPGHYRSHNPWFSNFRVIARRGRLWLNYHYYDASYEEPLVPAGEGVFKVGADPDTPERLYFDAPVQGACLRANFWGGDYYRTFTP